VCVCGIYYYNICVRAVAVDGNDVCVYVCVCSIDITCVCV
jgi:hypothetical protein